MPRRFTPRNDRIKNIHNNKDLLYNKKAGLLIKGFFMKKINKGFSLGEVLIALGVIGIVAALSIKIMFYNVQDKQYKAQLRKTYENIKGACEALKVNYGTIPRALNTCSSDSNSNCFRDLIKTNLKYVNECNKGQSHGNCHPTTVYKLEYPEKTTNAGRANEAGLILSDGAGLLIELNSRNCLASENTLSGKCGSVIVDVNGLNNPNTLGKDIYKFILYRDGLLPLGTQGDGNDDCNTNSDGWGCAAHYLRGN